MMSTNAWFSTILTWLVVFGLTNNGTVATTISIIVLATFYLTTAIQRKRYKNSDFNEQQLQEIEKVMREPKGIEISPYEERIRRNLLVVSFFALAFICLDLQINPDSKLLGGMTFSNLTTNKIYILLLLIIWYELVHYLWNLKTSFMHWRVRLTGVSPIELRGNIDAEFISYTTSPLDHTGKDENSNLYVWLLERHQPPSEIVISNLEITVKTLQEMVDDIKNTEPPTPNNPEIFTELEKQTKKLCDHTEKLLKYFSDNKSLVTEIAENIRMNGSLLRFDQWFRLLINSQNIRWLFLDAILPLSLALIAISLLISEIQIN